MREGQRNAILSKKLHAVAQTVLLFRREALPPVLEFVGELDLNRRNSIIMYR
jgi:hypothetical protein